MKNVHTLFNKFQYINKKDEKIFKQDISDMNYANKGYKKKVFWESVTLVCCATRYG